MKETGIDTTIMQEGEYVGADEGTDRKGTVELFSGILWNAYSGLSGRGKSAVFFYWFIF